MPKTTTVWSVWLCSILLCPHFFSRSRITLASAEFLSVPEDLQSNCSILSRFCARECLLLFYFIRLWTILENESSTSLEPLAGGQEIVVQCHSLSVRTHVSALVHKIGFKFGWELDKECATLVLC